jgi:hypothetical protein
VLADRLQEERERSGIKDNTEALVLSNEENGSDYSLNISPKVYG